MFGGPKTLSPFLVRFPGDITTLKHVHFEVFRPFLAMVNGDAMYSDKNRRSNDSDFQRKNKALLSQFQALHRCFCLIDMHGNVGSITPKRRLPKEDVNETEA